MEIVFKVLFIISMPVAITLGCDFLLNDIAICLWGTGCIILVVHSEEYV